MPADRYAVGIDLGGSKLRGGLLSQEGQLVARTQQGEVPMREYLSQFVGENPELLPARIVGGSGAASTQRGASPSGVDLDKIRAGMTDTEMEQVRQEIARIASQHGRGV